jgi:UDP-N-acetylmuramoylalanine--D-glutamate ligase
VSILLNITPDHLDRHGGMDQYIVAKENIFANVRNDSSSHIAVIGQDTEPCVQIMNRLREQNLWTIIPISTKQSLPNGVWVDQAGLLYDQNNYIADLTTHEFLKGAHNFENIAACYASIRYGFGYESATIIKAIFSFKGLAHRQAFVRRIGKTIFINDSKATNADAAEKALKSYKNIYWIAGGRAKETGVSGLEQYFPTIKMTALIGESMEEFSKVLDVHGAPYIRSETLENAIHDLWNIAMKDREDSVILLSPACASFDQFKSFEHRGEEFENIVMNISEQINHIA